MTTHRVDPGCGKGCSLWPSSSLNQQFVGRMEWGEVNKREWWRGSGGVVWGVVVMSRGSSINRHMRWTKKSKAVQCRWGQRRDNKDILRHDHVTWIKVCFRQWPLTPLLKAPKKEWYMSDNCTLKALIPPWFHYWLKKMLELNTLR